MAGEKEEKALATNRAAFHDYHIGDKYEAGLSLKGTEVKSVMAGRVQLKTLTWLSAMVNMVV